MRKFKYSQERFALYKKMSVLLAGLIIFGFFLIARFASPGARHIPTAITLIPLVIMLAMFALFGRYAFKAMGETYFELDDNGLSKKRGEETLRRINFADLRRFVIWNDDEDEVKGILLKDTRKFAISLLEEMNFLADLIKEKAPIAPVMKKVASQRRRLLLNGLYVAIIFFIVGLLFYFDIATSDAFELILFTILFFLFFIRRPVSRVFGRKWRYVEYGFCCFFAFYVIMMIANMLR